MQRSNEIEKNYKNNFNNMLEKIMRVTDLLRDKKEAVDEQSYKNKVNSLSENVFSKLKWETKKNNSEKTMERAEKINAILEEMQHLYDVVFEIQDDDETPNVQAAKIMGDLNEACEDLKQALLGDEVDDSCDSSASNEDSPSLEDSKSNTPSTAEKMKKRLNKVVKSVQNAATTNNKAEHEARMQRCGVLLDGIPSIGQKILIQVIAEVNSRTVITTNNPSQLPRISNGAAILMQKHDLESSNEKLQAKIGELEKRLEVNDSKIQSDYELMLEYYNQINDLNNEKVILQQRLVEKENKLEQLDVRVERGDTDLNNLNNKMTSKDQTIQDLTNKLNALHLANDISNDKKNELQGALEKFEKLQAENDELKNNVNQSSTKSEAEAVE